MVMKEKNDYLAGTPRLYVPDDVKESTTLSLDDKAAHYLKNVLRCPDGMGLRLFNGKHGEFLAAVRFDKKNVLLDVKEKLHEQPIAPHELHLVFPPIKKDRMDFMIEKAVELGATHFHPVLTRQTSVRDINAERVTKQIIEACEQCERLDIPVITALSGLDVFLKKWPDDIPLYAAIEREDAPHLAEIKPSSKSGFLIGPEGGFSQEEKTLLLSHEKIKPISLGQNILRAETAAILGLGLLSTLTD